MNITIKTIPHSEQRYETVGDWFFSGEDLEIRVSSMNNWRHEALVAIHELAEVLICMHNGVTQEEVDAFDAQYETDRKIGRHGETDEPGDDFAAPYRKEHGIASGVERIVGAELGVDWNEYENQVERLSKT